MRAFAPTLGVLLFCNWAASVVGFRWAMELFADFRIEMPPLTLLMMWATKGVPLLLGAAFVAFSSIPIARRAQFGWPFGLIVCLMCDLMFLGYALQVNTFIEAIGVGQSMSFLSKVELLTSSFSGLDFTAMTERYEVGALLLAASFVLTQVILGALTFGSRGLVAPRSECREIA